MRLVEARIVLHRARPERKQPGIDAVIHLAQAHVVAHGFGLGQARQADRVLALQSAETRRERFRFVEVDAGGFMMADLEDQRLDLRQRLVAGEGRMNGAAGFAG